MRLMLCPVLQSKLMLLIRLQDQPCLWVLQKWSHIVCFLMYLLLEGNDLAVREGVCIVLDGMSHVHPCAAPLYPSSPAARWVLSHGKVQGTKSKHMIFPSEMMCAQFISVFGMSAVK